MSTATQFTVAEGDLTLDDHEAIAATLARAFDDYSHWYQGSRSWAGMQPEVRVIVRDVPSADDSPTDVDPSDGEPTSPAGVGPVLAHAGIRRMFVTVGEEDLLIASVGMVAVAPAAQGTGLGAVLLAAVDTVLDDLEVPFGLLETGEGVQGFYRKHGWQPLEGVTGSYNAFTADGAATLVTQDVGWLVKPTRASLADWPLGDLQVNGQIV